MNGSGTRLEHAEQHLSKAQSVLGTAERALQAAERAQAAAERAGTNLRTVNLLALAGAMGFAVVLFLTRRHG